MQKKTEKKTQSPIIESLLLNDQPASLTDSQPLSIGHKKFSNRNNFK
jgi:hypothetical protein